MCFTPLHGKMQFSRSDNSRTPSNKTIIPCLPTVAVVEPFSNYIRLPIRRNLPRRGHFAMPSYCDIDDNGDAPQEDPCAWPSVVSTMAGFEAPALTRIRALRLWNVTENPDHPDLLVLPSGRAYYLVRSIIGSLFGSVFHGVGGVCPDPNNPARFLVPSQTSEQRQFAIKRSRIEMMRHTPQENVFREISVMRYLSGDSGHPHVMPLVDACITSTHVYVVTPFCHGGDLLKSVVPMEGTGESRARRWFRQILEGVGYIHSKGLCHHDLSPENVVISGQGSAAVVMDMGMVQRIPIGDGGEPAPMRDRERFGKLRYMAPEIYAGEEYDGRQVDIWSIGVILVVCIAGEYPWEAPTRIPVPQRNLFQSDIDRFRHLADHGVEVMLHWMNLAPPRVSHEALDLLRQMLVIDRTIRPYSVARLAEHAFCRL